MKNPKRKSAKSVNTGKPYEHATVAFLQKKFPSATVERPTKRTPGRRGSEDIDVLVTYTTDGIQWRIGVECKDRGRPLTMDEYGSIEVKFKSAHVDMGIIVCRKGVQEGVIRRMESSGFRFGQTIVKSIDELLDGSWPETFLASLRELAAAKENGHPDPVIALKVATAIKSKDDFGAFFLHDLKNIAWLSILEREGVWTEAAEGKISLPPALVADYLTLGLPEHAEIFLGYCSKLTTNTNWYGSRQLVAGSIQLSNEDRARFFELAAAWPFWNLGHHEQIDTLLTHEFENGRAERALAFLGPLVKIDAEFHEVLPNYSSARIRNEDREYDFEQVFGTLLPKLAPLAPTNASQFLREIIDKAELLLGIEAASRFKFIRHVKNRPDFILDRCLGTLVDSYLKCLDSCAKVSPEGLSQHCAASLEKSRTVLSRRCALSALADAPSVRARFIETIYADDGLWQTHELIPELESFVLATWNTAGDVQQRKVCERLINEANEAKTMDDVERSRWPKVRILQWLIAIAKQGIPAACTAHVDELMMDFIHETGVTEQADRSPREVMARFMDPVPDDARNFAQMSVENVISYCIAFVPIISFMDHKTPYGVGQMLRADILARPNDYLASRTLTDLPSPVLRAEAIGAIADAVCGEGKVAIQSLHDLSVHFLVNEASPAGDSVVGAGNEEDVARAVADALEHIADQCDRFFTAAELQQLIALCGLLVQLPTERPAPNDNDGVLSATLNSLEGKVALAVGAVAMRCLRQLRMDGPCYPPDQARPIYENAREILETYVLGSNTPHVRAVIGRVFPELCRFDREWLVKNLHKIFSEAAQDCSDGVWEALFQSHPNLDVIEFCQANYRNALEKCKTDGKLPCWATFAGHYAGLLWYLRELTTDDPLVKLLFETRLEVLEAAEWAVGRYLYEAKGSKDDWSRAIEVWKEMGQRCPDLTSHSFIWLRHAPVELQTKDILDLVHLAVKAKSREYYPLYEFLSKRAEKEPAATALALELIFERDAPWPIGHDVSNIKHCLRSSYQHGDEDTKSRAVKCVESLIRKKCFAFAELIDEFQ